MNGSAADYDFSGKRVFLSGPMTGLPGFNRKAFMEAEGRLYAAGAADVYNPARLVDMDDVGGTPHERYMARTLHELTSHNWTASGGWFTPYYDCVALLPGWESSDGALAEIAVAQAVGIRTVEL